jgi:hypothetical protein
MADKKNGDYEKPESKGMGDELDDVSGGAGTGGPCTSGYSAQGQACGEGSQPTACEHGSYFGGTGDCIGGGQPGQGCRSGRVL